MAGCCVTASRRLSETWASWLAGDDGLRPADSLLPKDALRYGHSNQTLVKRPSKSTLPYGMRAQVVAELSCQN